MRVTVAFADGVLAGERVELDVKDCLHELTIAVEPGGAWCVMGVYPPGWTRKALAYLYRHAETVDGRRVYREVPWPDTAAWSASN